MEEKVSQMISPRFHAPYEIVQVKSHPGQWLVMTPVEGSKHPSEPLPTQCPVVGVLE
jgi:hypothetical protein